MHCSRKQSASEGAWETGECIFDEKQIVSEEYTGNLVLPCADYEVPLRVVSELLRVGVEGQCEKDVSGMEEQL